MPGQSVLTRLIHFELDKGGPPDGFEVVSFSGTEALSTQYSYTISLASKDAIHDFDAMLEAKAHLSFGDPVAHVHGMLCSVQQGYDASFKTENELLTRVDVVLVPEMWKLTLNVRTKFYLDMKVDQIIKNILGDHGLQAEFDLSLVHPRRKSVLQFQESDLDFVHRLCEREGIHYHFIHEESQDKIVFSDKNGAFKTIQDVTDLPLRVPVSTGGKSMIGPWGEERTIRRFQSRQRFSPKKVILQDYNDQDPHGDLKVEGEAPGRASQGIQYFFGEHYKDTNEGGVLRDIRKEEILARKRIFFGASNAYFLYAGGKFKVENAKTVDSAFPEEYIVTELQAEGSQPLGGTSQEEGYNFANTFTCIPSDVVFRPSLRTRWPDMQGVYHAKVISSSDKYSGVEEQGRYKVQFLFDIDKAGSIPVRKIEPYVGGNYGFHAPLHDGVEVLCAFENGDCDRPVIVSAVHNPDFPNTIKNSNHTQSIWRSGGNNELKMEDTKGSELFYQHCEKDHEVKTENDKQENIGHDEKQEVKNNRERKVGVDEKIEIGSNRKIKIGANLTEEVGGDTKITVTGKHEEKIDGTLTLSVTGATEMNFKADQKITVGGGKTESVSGKVKETFSAAHETKVSADRKLTVGGKMDETVTGNITRKSSANIKDQAGSNWEAKAGSNATVKAGAIGKFQAGGALTLKAGGAASLKAGGAVLVKSGAALNIKASGAVKVKGSMVDCMAGSLKVT